MNSGVSHLTAEGACLYNCRKAGGIGLACVGSGDSHLTDCGEESSVSGTRSADSSSLNAGDNSIIDFGSDAGSHFTTWSVAGSDGGRNLTDG